MSEFLAARNLLLRLRDDYDAAAAAFRWPRLHEFNWALDYFDPMARGNHAPALWIVEEDGTEQRFSFEEMAYRSSRMANFLRAHGISRGDRILMMLGNEPALWDVMLAATKLGAVIIPATTLLTPEDLTDRLERGGVQHVVAGAAHAAKFVAESGYTRFSVGTPVPPGWIDLAGATSQPTAFEPNGITRADDLLLLYFTSGTTSKPKLVPHTHASYPIGHLSTMYWLGLSPGDIHLNISSPGWAKHAWSCVFAPWNAGACVFIYNTPRFSAPALLEALARYGVTSLCAPPTVWRLLIQENLPAWKDRLVLRSVVGAGEPLNPEIIGQIRSAWGLQLRDGYGQTETTAQIGNSPGLPVKLGSMGKPMPGYRIVLRDADGREVDEGEICIDMRPGCLAVTSGYHDNPERSSEALRDGYYHTGDTAVRDADGHFTFVGRADDVFKASDYRISPFEIESALIEHEAIVEVAVVPSPHPTRLAVPKAYLTLVSDRVGNAALARDILAFAKRQLAPYKRVRRIEFADELPKTISGKIRRVQLRKAEIERYSANVRGEHEYAEEDFPDLRD